MLNISRKSGLHIFRASRTISAAKWNLAQLARKSSFLYPNEDKAHIIPNLIDFESEDTLKNAKEMEEKIRELQSLVEKFSKGKFSEFLIIPTLFITYL